MTRSSMPKQLMKAPKNPAMAAKRPNKPGKAPPMPKVPMKGFRKGGKVGC